jgi:hypothetical protein
VNAEKQSAAEKQAAHKDAGGHPQNPGRIMRLPGASVKTSPQHQVR